jgi:3,4-dihydroxy 2-butanone 4-phosphate synthase/GTP cyclohydrolase II
MLVKEVFVESMDDFVPIYRYDVPFDNPAEGETTAYVIGDFETLRQIDPGPLVRLHSACFNGEVLRLAECECGPQLQAAWDLMLKAGAGILFYLNSQEGRGAGANEEVQAALGGNVDVRLAGARVKVWGYMLKHLVGWDTAESYSAMGLPFDMRRYGHCGRFLLKHGIGEVVLMTNNPDKRDQLAWPNGFGNEGIIVNIKPHILGITEYSIDYMRVKARMGHNLPPEILDAQLKNTD